jgi:hypothetical protein
MLDKLVQVNHPKCFPPFAVRVKFMETIHDVTGVLGAGPRSDSSIVFHPSSPGDSAAVR